MERCMERREKNPHLAAHGKLVYMPPLAVALWQGTPPPIDFVGTLRGHSTAWALEELATAAASAAADGAQLLVMPELFLGGYRALAQIKNPCALRVGVSADIDRVCAIACQHRLCIVVGFFERGGDNEIYNSAMAVDSDGTVASIYRKTHLFGPAEEAAFTPGNELGQVFRLCGGVACALLICCTPNEIETTAHPCVSVLWSPCWDR